MKDLQGFPPRGKDVQVVSAHSETSPFFLHREKTLFFRVTKPNFEIEYLVKITGVFLFRGHGGFVRDNLPSQLFFLLCSFEARL